MGEVMGKNHQYGGVEVTAKRGEGFDSLLRRFTRKFKQSGITQEYKSREFYLKPSKKRNSKRRKNKRKTKEI